MAAKAKYQATLTATIAELRTTRRTAIQAHIDAVRDRMVVEMNDEIDALRDRLQAFIDAAEALP